MMWHIMSILINHSKNNNMDEPKHKMSYLPWLSYKNRVLTKRINFHHEIMCHIVKDFISRVWLEKWYFFSSLIQILVKDDHFLPKRCGQLHCWRIHPTPFQMERIVIQTDLPGASPISFSIHSSFIDLSKAFE